MFKIIHQWDYFIDRSPIRFTISENIPTLIQALWIKSSLEKEWAACPGHILLIEKIN